MPGSLSHLTSRFLDVVTAKPLSDGEKAVVRDWLAPGLAELFFAQEPHDQRHGYHAALVVVARGIQDREAIEAALVHDVGKRHASLGVIGRSLGSILIKSGLPVSSRIAAYRDHGLIAARELADRGASRLAVDFAAHHHGDRPSTIDLDLWHVLQEADQPPKPRLLRNAGIISAAK